MHTAHRPIHRIGWGTTTLVLAATITALTTPTANASIEDEVPNVWDCSTGSCNLPSTYVVGHTYMFSPGSPGGMPTTDPLHTSANFYADGKCLGGYSLPHTGSDSVPWMPTAAGTHTLTLRYLDIIPFVYTPATVLTVTVVAAPAGSPTPQPPAPLGSCTGSGSADLFNPIGSGGTKGTGSA
ncbi:hypothetical protein [Nocardia heshunensis]